MTDWPTASFGRHESRSSLACWDVTTTVPSWSPAFPRIAADEGWPAGSRATTITGMRRLALMALVAASVAGLAGCSGSQPGTGSLGPSPSASLTPVHLVSKCSPIASSTSATYDLTLTNAPQNRDVTVTFAQVDFYRDGDLVAHQEIPGGVIKPGQTISLGQFEISGISGHDWTCKMASYAGGER
jgi:hypothetical protein